MQRIKELGTFYKIAAGKYPKGKFANQQFTNRYKFALEIFKEMKAEN